MRKTCVFSLLALCSIGVLAKDDVSIPYVYDLEQTGNYAVPELPAVSALKKVQFLTNPFEWSNSTDTIDGFAEWEQRRYEIAQEIQNYEIGVKPVVNASQIKATFSGNTLTVVVTVGSNTLTLSSAISFPASAKKPCPLMIGTSMNSLPSSFFSENGIATMTFSESQVNNYSQFNTGGNGNGKFNKLYPEYSTNGAYAMWSWGVSRLIDGLFQLGSEKTGIDLSHIGVTGCSYAGKMALFAGAFDERIALTIAQEPGGGGAASWRYSETLDGVETLGATDGNWYKNTFKSNFSGSNCYKLPYDHHELVAMCCPRACLILGNPTMKWLADESTYVSSCAARKVWEKFGIEDRMGYSIVGGHDHCSLPSNQYDDVLRFIRRYLLNDTSVSTDVRVAPTYTGVNVNKWIEEWASKSQEEMSAEKEWEKAFKVFAECEDLIANGYGTSYKVVSGQSASKVSNGKYVEVVKNWTGSTSEPDSDRSKMLRAEFEIPESGTYFLFVRCNLPDYDGDSYFVRFDDSGSWKFINEGPTSGWQWLSYLSKNLSPGKHSVTLASREDNALFDRICITDNIDGPGLFDDVYTSVTAIAAQQQFGFAPVFADNHLSFRFSIPEKSVVGFGLYDMQGHLLATAGGMEYEAGEHLLAIGSVLAESGNEYVCNITVNGTMSSVKILIP